MENFKLKKLIGQIHLWLGLSSGVIVFIVAITGCLYAFQEEIQNITEEYRFVDKQNKEFMLPSELEQIARKALPNKVLHSIKYSGTNKSAEAIFFHYKPSYYHILYLNPYTGELLQKVNMEEGFFHFILDGHYFLWLPEEIGQPVVASATLIFLTLILSGLYLWFPKNKNALKQRFWFRWKDKTKWKRKNYDVHNITGFYVFLIAALFAITGLVWGFEWFANSYYSLLGGEKSLIYQEPPSTKTAVPTHKPLDKVYLKMQKEYPLAKSIEVHPPENDSVSIAVNINPEEGTYWRINYRYFDQYTLQEKEVDHLFGKFQNANLADKAMRMNYDLHTGAVFGVTGKIFAFCISLLIATLPITGFYIWWGRNKKARQKQDN